MISEEKKFEMIYKFFEKNQFYYWVSLKFITTLNLFYNEFPLHLYNNFQLDECIQNIDYMIFFYSYQY